MQVLLAYVVLEHVLKGQYSQPGYVYKSNVAEKLLFY